MKLLDRKEGKYLVLKLQERRLDATIVVEFTDKVNEFIRKGERHILLNLAEIVYIDSRGLGAIINTLKHVGAKGSLVVCEPSESVKTFFKLTKMDKVFRIFATEMDALAILVKK